MLIGGPSGVGKSTVARLVGQRFGASWLQIDDLRLALQWSRAQLPENGTDILSYFDDTSDVWLQPPEQLRDALIATSRVMEPAVEIVVRNHVDTATPVVIEGDGFAPSLLLRPEIAIRVEAAQVRAIFLTEQDEGTLLANAVARSRGNSGWSEVELQTQARAKWLYGNWLTDQARRQGLPVLNVRPWETLLERIMVASGAAGLVRTRDEVS